MFDSLYTPRVSHHWLIMSIVYQNKKIKVLDNGWIPRINRKMLTGAKYKDKERTPGLEPHAGHGGQGLCCPGFGAPFKSFPQTHKM